MKCLKQKRKVSFFFADENVENKNIGNILSSETLLTTTNSSYNENDKENNIENPLMEADKSDSADELNRTYTISPIPTIPPTPPPRIFQSNTEISRQTSFSKRSPIRPCKHRILVEDGSCQRCKTVVKNKMFSPVITPEDKENEFESNALIPENKSSSPRKSEAITTLPWPLSSRKALAPFVLVNPTKGRFIIQKDTELIFEAVDRESNSNEYLIKYIFRVSKDNLKQQVASLISTSKIIGEYSGLQHLDFHFPGYYKNICRALKIISGRVPRIECKNILEIKQLYARIMINGDFRLIFPDNRIFVQKFGTLSDKIESPKGAEYSLTQNDRNIFDKARMHLHELDEIHRKTNGPNYYGIVIHVCLKSEEDSIIHESFKSPTFQSNIPGKRE
uniref:Uncharacterized protein n=1 Tax=Panagrolaimus superbus TaxID=310955 RepID=A0A914ZA90_9BILA